MINTTEKSTTVVGSLCTVPSLPVVHTQRHARTGEGWGDHVHFQAPVAGRRRRTRSLASTSPRPPCPTHTDALVVRKNVNRGKKQAVGAHRSAGLRDDAAGPTVTGPAALPTVGADAALDCPPQPPTRASADCAPSHRPPLRAGRKAATPTMLRWGQNLCPYMGSIQAPSMEVTRRPEARACAPVRHAHTSCA
jgi:hypothetical protein